jgi:hypothetical protein
LRLGLIQISYQGVTKKHGSSDLGKLLKSQVEETRRTPFSLLFNIKLCRYSRNGYAKPANLQIDERVL